MVYESTNQFEAAEQSYQKSLNIEVQRGSRNGQAISLGQLGNLYSKVGRHEEAIRLYRQAADIGVRLGNLRDEGRWRSNMADELVRLRRYDEARIEIQRAIECDKPFGHVAEPWKTFSTLFNLERAVGNQPAALEGRNRAIAAYLAYRRAGGAPQIGTTKVMEVVKKDPAGARAALDKADVDYRVAAEITLALEGLDLQL